MQLSTIALIYFIGYLCAILAIVVWFRKIKKRGEKIPLKAKIFVAFIILSGPSVIAMIFSPSPSLISENPPSVMNTYYVKTSSANIRECPSTSCKIIDSLPQNERLTFPGNSFDKYPDWAEVTFPNGQIGYVSKTTLSENPVSERQLTPTDDASSIGGITVGPWDNIQTTVGESYKFHFCEPPSAISGATCGALADTTTDPKGGTPPYSFVKKSGFLPLGMVLELNGTLSGSPTEAGTYNFRLCAKDLYGGEGCQNLTVTVTNGAEAPKLAPAPVAEEADFVNIESATCQAKGYSTPGNPNSWIVYRVTVTGTGGGSVGSDIGFYCDARYGGGPCWNQFSSCDAWTKHPEYEYCRREAGQSAVTGWTYWAEGAMNRDIGFNFGVKAGFEDAIYKNIPCGN